MEKTKLIKFCLNLLIQETDVLGMHLLTKFLSKQFIPFDMINFKEWGVTSLPLLIRLLSKSVTSKIKTKLSSVDRITEDDRFLLPIYPAPSFLNMSRLFISDLINDLKTLIELKFIKWSSFFI